MSKFPSSIVFFVVGNEFDAMTIANKAAFLGCEVINIQTETVQDFGPEIMHERNMFRIWIGCFLSTKEELSEDIEGMFRSDPFFKSWRKIDR